MVEKHEPPQRKRQMTWFQRQVEKFAMSKAGTWCILNINRRVDPVLARWTGGRVAITNLIGAPLAILTTIGAKSGLERTTPLLYVPHGDDIILIASYGGNPRNPAWYYNLRAHPEARLLIHGLERTYIAREVKGREREALWAEAVGFYAGFAKYQQRAGDRTIPVLLLCPKS
jgi:deazaflavin-dependent oxidoreductase (nitroreductase family)